MASLPENLIESELFGYEKVPLQVQRKELLDTEKANGGHYFWTKLGCAIIFKLSFKSITVWELSGWRKRYYKTDVRIISYTNKDLLNG